MFVPEQMGGRREVTLLCVSLLAVLTVGCGTNAAHKLNGHGLALVLPAGWHGRIYQRPGGLPILQAANFPLPPNDDDPATKAIQRMSDRSVLIVLLESATGGVTGGPSGFSFKAVKLPVRVRRSDFGPRVEGVPSSHAFARRLITTHGRGFMLWVQFGARPAPAHLLEQANSVLAGLKVSPSS